MLPDQIGRYLIEARLGQGGMGTVYLALDPLIKRQVAVKVLPQQFNHEPTFRERFRREAEIIASLEHPSIVPLHDFGEHENQPFIVMRYMPGGTLSDRLKRGPLSMSRIINIMERIAPGLDKAHVHGVVHRDLKPSNILFDADDEAYLADFGIAKVQEATAALTGSAIIGTPAYMSPEQAQGEKDIDGRSDVYAMGIILFQMLSGRAPYIADTPMKLVVMHIMEPVPAILPVKPELPEKIEPLISRALAKDPKDRFYTVGDMTQTLRHIITEARRQSGSILPVGVTGPLKETSPPASEGVDLLAETTVEPEVVQGSSTPALLSPPQLSAQTVPEPEAEVPVRDRPPATGPLTGSAPSSQVTPAPHGPKRRRFAPWIWLAGLGGVGVIAVVLILAALGIYWFVYRTPNAPPALQSPTATLEIVQVNPTATTAVVLPTSPPDPNPVAALYGPANGSLFHEQDGFIAADIAELDVQNFIVEATFINPYSPAVGPWDAGFLFRHTDTNDEFRLIIESNGRWGFYEWLAGVEFLLAEGFLDNLDLLEGSGNQLRLIVYDNLGLLYVNNVLISNLNLGSRLFSGDIMIATDLTLDYEISGEVTNYQDFTIKPLDPLIGPWDGALVHDEGDFLTEEITGLDIQNFIVEGTFFNPDPTSEGIWDTGYLFRHLGPDDQFRLFIDSTGYWSLTNWENGESILINDGTVFDLDTSTQGANQVQLIAVDGVGLFFVNGVYISPLDLTDRIFSGNLSLAIDYKIPGETTSYINFTVIPLP